MKKSIPVQPQMGRIRSVLPPKLLRSKIGTTQRCDKGHEPPTPRRQLEKWIRTRGGKIRRNVSHRPTSLCTLHANDSFPQTPQIVYPIFRGIAIGLAKNLEKKTDSQNHTKTAGISPAQKEIAGRTGDRKPGKYPLQTIYMG